MHPHANRRPSAQTAPPDDMRVRPHRSLREWIQAWRTVMRDPDKAIPDPGIGAEGQPIPPELDLHCPECNRPLAGLTEWVCPRCEGKFNPLRAYTLRMLQEPEYFLRYQLDPDDIRKALWAMVLTVLGLVLVLIATVIAVKRGQAGWLPIWTAYKATSAFLGLSIPITALLHFGFEIVLPRIFFFFSVLWLLLCTALLILTLV